MSFAVDPDVLVIGGGNAGLCAALAARRRGASVLLVERATKFRRGGNSKYTRNLRCVHDQPDEVMSGTYSEAELAADLASVSGPGADELITRFVVERSRLAPRWMEANGVRWQAAMRGTLQLSRTNRFFLGGGRALVNVLYATAERLGVDIVYECSVEELEFRDGQCVTAIARFDGKTLPLRPRAFVAASGGFEANLSWLRRYWGDAVDEYAVRGARENDGAVLAQLFDNGARQVGDPRGFHAIAVDARGPRFDGGIVTRLDSLPFGIVVDKSACRFHDEGEDLWPKRYAVWGRWIAERPGQRAFSIFDKKAVGRFMATAFPPFVAPTIEGLAAEVGLDPHTLSRTVREYNECVVDGEYDVSKLDSCRTEGLPIPKSHWALRIDEPPFFAYPLRPGITFTYLSVGIDTDTRVLRADGGPFSNVFGAGELVAGNVLTRGYLAGFGMTIGTVTGHVAGEKASVHARN